MKIKLSILALGFFSTISSAQQKTYTPTSEIPLDRPKLVVGIVVDQMRYDFLYRYWSSYSSGGFKRLLREGFQFSNCQYSYFPTYTGPGHASIYSGTTPRVHGIVGNNWWERGSKASMYCASDLQVEGIGSRGAEGKMSPRNMRSFSIADQLKLATNGKAKTFGISLKDRGAIFPAGHSADAAFWFDGESGNFISSSYYKQLNGRLPDWLQSFNGLNRANHYLQQTWSPLLPLQAYDQSTNDLESWENPISKTVEPRFPYDLKAIADGKPEMIRKTPFGNTILKEAALALIDGEKLGRDDVCDFLALSFSSPDVIGHDYGPFALETKDTYIRLDRDLAELLTALDAKVGKNRYLVMLTADHGILDIPEFSQSRSLPSFRFDDDQFEKAIREYALQKFKTDTWIEKVENLQIYLKPELWTELQANYPSVLTDILTFIRTFEGVADAFIYSGSRPFPEPAHLKKYEAGFYRKRSGDIQIMLEPGYLDSPRKKGTSHGSPWSYDSHVPCIWMGWNVLPGKSEEPMLIEDIAPTMAQILNILEPNGCTGSPKRIPLKRN